MGLKEWIIPQDAKFYARLDRVAAGGVEAAALLRELLRDPKRSPELRDRIKAVERGVDDVLHEIYENLAKTFITPIEHGDMSRLINSLDDFVDFIDASANRIHLYRLTDVDEGMVALGELIGRQAGHLQKAVTALREDKSEIHQHVIEIHSLENAADAILNAAISKLFEGHDAVRILKHKEVFEYLEEATDRAEDAANVVLDIVLKQA